MHFCSSALSYCVVYAMRPLTGSVPCGAPRTCHTTMRSCAMLLLQMCFESPGSSCIFKQFDPNTSRGMEHVRSTYGARTEHVTEHVRSTLVKTKRCSLSTVIRVLMLYPLIFRKGGVHIMWVFPTCSARAPYVLRTCSVRAPYVLHAFVRFAYFATNTAL